MKKGFKIAGLSLVVLALVANLHSALFTFYGIKTNSLAGQVWAQSTSTGTSTGGNTGGDETGGTSTDFLWDDKTNGCNKAETTIIPVRTYINAGSTASLGFNGNQLAHISLGNEGTFSVQNDYIVMYTPGKKLDCPIAPLHVCTPEDCEYPPGTKADYVFYNGQRINATTSRP